MSAGPSSPYAPAPPPPPPWGGPGQRERSAWAPHGSDGVPRPYVHQMRAKGYHPARPLLALLLAGGLFGVTMCLLGVVLLVGRSDLLAGTSTADLPLDDPFLLGWNNLLLAALIPITLVATRLGHWRPMGRVWSVEGRIRWRWLARATLVTLALWAPFLGIGLWADAGPGLDPSPQLPVLLAVILLTTPLQAAGEEVAFRGGLMQGIGAWIPHPVVALVVTAVLSAAVFALAHLSLDPWVILELTTVAACACYLTWRTGGLEAAIAFHVVNNVVLMAGLAVIGGLSDAFIGTDTQGAAGPSLLAAAANIGLTLVLVWQAERAGIAPTQRGAPALG